MLGNVDFMKRSLENLRELVQHSLATEKAREGRGKGPYEGDDDISMYGDGMKQPYGLSEVKKRRGVSHSTFRSYRSKLTPRYSAQHLPGDVTAATGLILLNGDEDQMAQERYVMHAGYTTPNLKGSVKWSNGRFDRRRWMREHENGYG